MTILAGLYRNVIRGFHGVAGAALLVMMLVVSADVILRAVFQLPIKGAYDVVESALLIATFFGIAAVVADRGEILIDLIDAILPKRGLRFLDLVSTAMGISTFAFIGWSMIAPALDAYRWGEQSLELGLPKWPLWALAFVGLGGIALGYLGRLFTPPGAPGPSDNQGDRGAGDGEVRE